MRPGRNGRVVPIEPTPRLTDLLRLTLDINGFPHVEFVSKAPFEADGQTLQLVVPERRSLNARLAEAVAASEEAVAVAAVTVDTLTADWPRVDLIKIDVEGAEEAVWRGMARTLADNPTIVVVLKFNAARYDDRRGRFSGRRIIRVRPPIHRRQLGGHGRFRPRRAFELRDPSLEPLDPLEPLARADLDRQRGLDSADRCVVSRARSSEVC
jgi:FkbM family methyltransferase